MRTESSRTQFAVTLVLALVLSAAAKAQTAPAPSEQARAEVARAVEAYNQGDFAQAIVHYGEAYRLDPRPGMLFNLAQCHRKLGDHPRAALYYQRYLAQFPDSKAPHAELVKRLIEETATPEAVAGTPDPGAVASEPVADAPIAIAEVASTAPSVQVSPMGQHGDAPILPTVPAVSAEPAKHETVLTRWWFWTGVAVAAAAAGTAVYLATPPDPRSTTLGTWDLR